MQCWGLFNGKPGSSWSESCRICWGKLKINKHPAISNSMTELEKEINTLRSGLRAVETVSTIEIKYSPALLRAPQHPSLGRQARELPAKLLSSHIPEICLSFLPALHVRLSS